MLHTPTYIPYLQNTRMMGIDYGEKRIGVALSDTTWIIGSPHVIINSKGMEQDVAAIAKIMEEQDVAGLVVGMPRPKKQEGNTASLCKKILEFRAAVQETTQQPVSLYDETFSSKVSEQILTEMGLGRKKKLYVDKMAAAYVLQSFLQWNKSQIENGSFPS